MPNFSASISKNRNLLPVEQDLAKIIESIGHVVTSRHVIDPETTAYPNWEKDYNPKQLYEREKKRLSDSDVLITEATIPSFGAGFLIDQAITMKKPLLTMHYGLSEEKATLMLRGRAEEINLKMYTEDTARAVIDRFFKSLSK